MFIQANLSEDDGTYRFFIDTDEHSTNGFIVAKCGMFDNSEQSVSVDLPLPPEPVGDDDEDAVA